MKALQKDPELRIQTAKEFRALLEKVAKLPESSIRVVTVTNDSTTRGIRPAQLLSTDTSFEVPVSPDPTSRLSRMAWAILIGLALFSTVSVFAVGRLLLAKFGGP
jgi:hypothetical protein